MSDPLPIVDRIPLGYPYPCWPHPHGTHTDGGPHSHSGPYPYSGPHTHGGPHTLGGLLSHGRPYTYGGTHTLGGLLSLGRPYTYGGTHTHGVPHICVKLHQYPLVPRPLCIEPLPSTPVYRVIFSCLMLNMRTLISYTMSIYYN